MSQPDNLDRQPILTGSAVELRPLGENDWTPLYSVASDPEIWAQHPMHDRWQEPVFRAFFDDAMAGGGALAIRDHHSGAIIGSSQIRPHPLDESQTEIGWTFLARDRWGTGANAQVKALMVGHVLAARERVVFRVGDTNMRSRRAMEKIGARLTAAVQHGMAHGQPIQHVVYEITRRDYTNGPLVSL